MARYLGHQITADFYECSPAVLDSQELIEAYMIGAAALSGCEVVSAAFHKFSPQGVSGVVIVKESHFAVHTWPENGYAAVDVFTCGEIDPNQAVIYLKEAFSCSHFSLSETKRGALLD